MHVYFESNQGNIERFVREVRARIIAKTSVDVVEARDDTLTSVDIQDYSREQQLYLSCLLPKMSTAIRQRADEFYQLIPGQNPSGVMYSMRWGRKAALDRIIEDVFDDLFLWDINPRASKFRTKRFLGEGNNGELLIEQDYNGITFESFKKIPDDELRTFLSIVMNNFGGFGKLDAKVVTEETYSGAVGVIDNTAFLNEELKEKTFFKGYSSVDDAIREATALRHIGGSRLMRDNSCHLLHFSNEGYLTIGDHSFILIEGAKSRNERRSFNWHQYYFEMLEDKIEGFDWHDSITQRMYTVAAFHSDMQDIFIPSMYTDMFQLDRFQDEDVILEHLAYDSELQRQVELVYSGIVDKHRSLPKTVLAHNDTHPGNWEGSLLIDHGLVSFGQEYGDVEKALYDVPMEKRDKYRAVYTEFRKLMNVDAGHENLYSPNMDSFKKRCLERGITDSSRFIWWCRSQGYDHSFYEKNLRDSLAQLK